MKQLIIVVLIASSGYTLFAQQNESDVIRALEKLEADAVLNNDTVALSTIWDLNFVVNSPNNTIIGSGTSLAERPALQRKRIKFVRDVERVTIQDNTAISMGNELVEFEAEANGRSEKITRRYTNIWMKKANGWKLIARHANVICK